jgi:hypothetical protein
VADFLSILKIFGGFAPKSLNPPLLSDSFLDADFLKIGTYFGGLAAIESFPRAPKGTHFLLCEQPVSLNLGILGDFQNHLHGGKTFLEGKPMVAFLFSCPDHLPTDLLIELSPLELWNSLPISFGHPSSLSFLSSCFVSNLSNCSLYQTYPTTTLAVI